jgi:hypothetical protein
MRFATLLLLAVLVAPFPGRLRAQDAGKLGAGLQEACGAVLDPAREGLLLGTVKDSGSAVPLPGAVVRAVWRAPADTVDTVLETRTDSDGFCGFCRIPAGVQVTLAATLRVASRPAVLDIEAGMLHVEPILLPLSDPRSTGVLLGRIIDAELRRPIADAVVRLVEAGEATTTNPRGYFTFGSQSWGAYRLEIERLGYAPLSAAVRVAGNLSQVVELEMDPDAVELEGITVRVSPRASGLQIDGLVRRMTLGFGHFLTREVIERRPAAKVADLLREVPGMTVHRRLYGRVDLEVRGRACLPDVFVDGVPWAIDPDMGLDFNTGEIEALEVYRGVETPGEFLRAGRTLFPCAVVVVWTRRGG